MKKAILVLGLLALFIVLSGCFQPPSGKTLLFDSGKQIKSEEEAISLATEAIQMGNTGGPEELAEKYPVTTQTNEGYQITFAKDRLLGAQEAFDESECDEDVICFITCNAPRTSASGPVCSMPEEWESFIPQGERFKKENNILYKRKNYLCTEEDIEKGECQLGEWIPAKLDENNSTKFLVTYDGKVYIWLRLGIQ